MSEVTSERNSSQSLAKVLSISENVADEIREAAISSFSVNDTGGNLPLSKLLGRGERAKGTLTIDTDRYEVELHFERWESYGMYSMSSAGLDSERHVGCVAAKDKASGEVFQGRTLKVTPSGDLGTVPSGELSYGPIISAIKSNLERNKDVLEDALSYDLNELSHDDFKNASWSEDHEFGGGCYTSEINGMKISVERTNFLWHSVTATRDQGVFSIVTVEIKGSPARDIYKNVAALKSDEN